MNLTKNIVLNSDSYKYSQFSQYPPLTEGVYSYISSRGGKHKESLFFGLQMFLKEYMMHPVRMEDIDIAEEIISAHGEPFNRGGWEYIVKKYGGYLPVRIKAVSEGMVIPNQNVLLTIENTDPNCYWLTSFLETALLRAIWYPTTVATNSYHTKLLILNYLIRNGDPNQIDFKLHDFGFRGVSSHESAGIGGLAHLVNFKGTDTVAALLYGREYYHEPIAGFSIPAMEHSTVTSWGKDHEIDSFRNMLNMYAKPGALVACVSDSYDIYAACQNWGTVLKQEVIDSGATVVIRPDSGNPVEVVPRCAQILDDHFGSVVNAKGYKVLNNVRLIQGDAVTYEMIDRILYLLQENGFSADNIAFGQGGGLLQDVNRDDLKFAMKCSAVNVSGEWKDVFKDPVTDPGKTSMKGRLQLIETPEGYSTVNERDWNHDILRPVYENGKLFVDESLGEIRVRANQAVHNFFAESHC
jgi:nicotinamide phosphoribosyltransferase